METITPPPAHIPLAPEDWYWASWRNLPPLPRPAARPFDRAACMGLLRRMLPKNAYQLSWENSARNTYLALEQELHPAPEEACFWIELRRVLQAQADYDRAALIDAMASYQPDTAQMLDWSQEHIARVWLAPLMSLATPTQLVDLVIADERRTGAQRSSYARSFMAAFRTLVLPYLGAEEREQMRSRLRAGVDMARWPTLTSDGWGRACTSFYLAAALGMQDVIAQILAAVDAEREESQTNRFNNLDIDEIIYGIDSADVMQAQIQRYQEKGIVVSIHMRPWVAHTELAAVDMLIKSVAPSELAILPTPDLAPTMLAAIHEEEGKYHYTKKHLAAVRRWFYDYREIAVAGLRAIPGDSPLWPLAMRTLHQAALGNLPAPAGVLLAEAETPAWLREAAQAVAQHPKRHTALVDATLLPPIAHQGRLLTHDQLDAILHALRANADGQPAPLLALVRGWLAPDQRERLVEYIYGYWQALGGWRLMQQPWVFTSLGLLGQRRAIELLAHFIKMARQEDRSADVRRAISALGVSDSNAAVEVLLKLLRARSMRAYHPHVENLLAQIAAGRGCTVEELDRRHRVPTYGLDGSLWFGWETALYRPVLDSNCQPALRDASGNTYTQYPRPADARLKAIYKRERDRWHGYYHRMLEQIAAHVAWMEQAMIHQRRWSARELRETILEHPLLGPLARRQLWARYDPAQGHYSALLFDDNDMTIVDEKYQTIALDEQEQLVLAHPAAIPYQQRSHWIDLLHDYGVLSLFLQAGRPVYGLGTIAHTSDAIIGVEGVVIPEWGLNRALLQRRWNSRHERHNHTMRYFSGADITAVLAHEPATMASRQPSRALGYLWFVAGQHMSQRMIEHAPRMPLDQVDPIALSEAVWDVMQVLQG